MNNIFCLIKKSFRNINVEIWWLSGTVFYCGEKLIFHYFTPQNCFWLLSNLEIWRVFQKYKYLWHRTVVLWFCCCLATTEVKVSSLLTRPQVYLTINRLNASFQVLRTKFIHPCRGMPLPSVGSISSRAGRAGSCRSWHLPSGQKDNHDGLASNAFLLWVQASRSCGENKMPTVTLWIYV